MSAGNPKDLLYVPCELIAAPTDFTAASPYGGTRLGLVAEMDFQIAPQVYYIRDEAWGGAITDGILAAEPCALTCYLRTWDDDAIQKVFRDTTATGADGKRLIRNHLDTSATSRPGRLLSADGFRLAVCPLDPEHHPFLVIYNAVGVPEEEARLRFSQAKPMEFPLAFRGIPDSSFKVYQFGYRRSVSAT
jgi:hypothetical protein